jgi:pantetheine-phosphate adenylyltransferase
MEDINSRSNRIHSIRGKAIMAEQKLRVVSLGGTFDVIHKGHWFLLEEAFQVGEKIIIGVTTDEFARSLKKPHEIDCYNKRRTDVVEFIDRNSYNNRAVLIPLTDPYGPTIEENEIEGIIVSEETEPRAEEINEVRVTKGLRPLLIVVIKMILAEDGEPISSTRIRRQEVDRYGRLIG